MMEKKNNGVHNEKDLFHGSSKMEPCKIYSLENGFDMQFNKGMWGTVNYFAVAANYSSSSYAYSCFPQNWANVSCQGPLLETASKVVKIKDLQMPPPKMGTTGVKYDIWHSYRAC